MIAVFDLGTKTGYACNPNGVIVSGVWDTKPQKYEGGGMRFVKFVRRLNELHSANPITAIYFEAVRAHMGVDAAHVYGGFMSHLQAWCEVNKVPCDGVPVQTIKLHATGKGNAKKSAMEQAAVARGWNPVDDNEADALWLLDYCLKERSTQ